MTRYISFGVLIVTIILLTILFYQVMASFLIPLFLAALLVVIFRPIHVWVLEKLRGRQKLAALLTTAAILLAVLIPLGLLFVLAAAESRDLLAPEAGDSILVRVIRTRTKLGLDLPVGMRPVAIHFENLQQLTSDEDIDFHQSDLQSIRQESTTLIQHLFPQGLDENNPTNDSDELAVRRKQLWKQYYSEVDQVDDELFKLHENARDALEEDQRDAANTAYRNKLAATYNLFVKARNNHLGGKTMARLIETVNPSEQTLKMYKDSIFDFLRSKLLALSASTGSFVGSLFLGVIIMILSLYFFLLDGPAMIDAIKGLSPLDDAHEEELVQEFGKVSRAVVIATLLSALVQGLLGGIGYYFAGLESIFLLTLLTGCLALVPFVGAAAVWVPCSLYLYLIDGDPVAAIGLAIYGAAVVSMADNLIKPLILHGQSNLHPLVALLSVLGGVSALGPIGILIGPMIVAFLQTLLRILQRELMQMDSPPSANPAAS